MNDDIEQWNIESVWTNSTNSVTVDKRVYKIPTKCEGCGCDEVTHYTVINYGLCVFKCFKCSLAERLEEKKGVKNATISSNTTYNTPNGNYTITL